MNWKLVRGFGCFCILLSLLSVINFDIGVNSVSAESNDGEFYNEQFRLEQGASRFYVTSLEANETWTINCTAVYYGEFHLFLFTSRPTYDYILENGSIDPIIYDDAAIYNVTPSDIFSESLNSTVKTVSLEFKASAEAMYYLKIVLVTNGPDTFIINSNQLIQAYFIPFIPGYPVEVIAIGSLIGFSLIGIMVRKKIKKTR